MSTQEPEIPAGKPEGNPERERHAHSPTTGPPTGAIPIVFSVPSSPITSTATDTTVSLGDDYWFEDLEPEDFGLGAVWIGDSLHVF